MFPRALPEGGFPVYLASPKGHLRGCSSVVVRHVANVNVEGSSPFTRSEEEIPRRMPRDFAFWGAVIEARLVESPLSIVMATFPRSISPSRSVSREKLQGCRAGPLHSHPTSLLSGGMRLERTFVAIEGISPHHCCSCRDNST